MSFKLNNTPYPKLTGLPEITEVSKNSINIPNTRVNKKGEKSKAKTNAPYRDPNTFGPRVKRKGYHGWGPFQSNEEVNLSKMSGFGPSTAFGGVKNPELVKTKKTKSKTNKTKSKKVFKDGPKIPVSGIDLGKDPHWQPHQFRK